MKNAVILGKHPLTEDLIRQYQARGFRVTCVPSHDIDGIGTELFDEVFLLADISHPHPDEADYETVATAGILASRIPVPTLHKTKTVCHLMLLTPQMLHVLQTSDFCEAIRKKMDIYPFTMTGKWSESIRLDYQPIGYLSEKHVHLVIFGMNDISEMVALNATYMAHYPNYVRDHSLRTRITLIDKQVSAKSDAFTKRYQHLFDNSYYRLVIPSETKAIVKFHKPMYEGKREDFVDIEWEFVEAEANDTAIREKLKKWAADTRQLLTVVMADENGCKNASDALLLPDNLFQNHIPVYVFSKSYFRLDECPDIHGFGMLDRGYDITLPLVRMAKNINYIYDRCYEENYADGNASQEKDLSSYDQFLSPVDSMRYAVEIDHDARERSWSRLSIVKRMSSICNAMTIATKMRSIGLDETEWDKFYDITQQDIELLAQVEHNRWCVEELILGFRPCNEEEQRKTEMDVKTHKKALKSQMIHYDLRAYNDLRPDETGKSSKVYDRCLCSCLPLIAKAFADETAAELLQEPKED